MAPKHKIANLYSSKYYCGKKTKNLPRTTTFAQWPFRSSNPPPLPFLLPLHTGGRSSFSKLMEMGRFENFCYKSRGKAKWGVCLEMGGFPYYIGVFLKIPFVFILPLLTNMYFKIIAQIKYQMIGIVIILIVLIVIIAVLIIHVNNKYSA